jgi:Fur family transcriptional regulator, ferric uptake regulator
MVSTPERDVRETFRRSGYTLTSQRRAVLDALKDFKGHPSAEEVYLLVKKRNPRVALGTVYQALRPEHVPPLRHPVYEVR